MLRTIDSSYKCTEFRFDSWFLKRIWTWFGLSHQWLMTSLEPLTWKRSDVLNQTGSVLKMETLELCSAHNPVQILSAEPLFPPLDALTSSLHLLCIRQFSKQIWKRRRNNKSWVYLSNELATVQQRCTVMLYYSRILNPHRSKFLRLIAILEKVT